MRVLVGSRNPVKVGATKEAFSIFFHTVEVRGIAVSSGVASQPVGEETFRGAENRASRLRIRNEEEDLNADFFVGIEGGIVELFSRWFVFGVMCIMDRRGMKGYGCTPLFESPPVITGELLKGRELGDVMDELTGTEHTKQKQGAVGYFTRGVMDRKRYYVDGLIVALIPFLNQDLYSCSCPCSSSSR